MDADEIKDTVRDRKTFLPVELVDSDLRAAGCMDRVCALPHDLNERTSYLGDLLVSMVNQQHKGTNLGVVAGQLCRSLSYLLNSSSWRDGELHAFDLDEIKRKLKSFTR